MSRSLRKRGLRCSRAAQTHGEVGAPHAHHSGVCVDEVQARSAFDEWVYACGRIASITNSAHVTFGLLLNH